MPDDMKTLSTLDWNEIDQYKFAPEEEVVSSVLDATPLSEGQRKEAVRIGQEIVLTARQNARRKGMMESFLEEFGLSNQEGISLMCLAEALIRVPDAETRDDLIAEKIRSGDWSSHLNQSESWLVNASTWGLMLTGRVLGPSADAVRSPAKFVQSLVRESGEPVIRAAMMQAMRIMGEQFVLGRTVEAAIKRGKKMIREDEAAHFSFDMLGEGARTAADADRYMEAYKTSIRSIDDATEGHPPELENGVSVKLSALHAKYDIYHEDRVMEELYPRVLELCEMANRRGIHLCLDAEEADRLVLQMEIIDRLAHEPSLKGWKGLGMAIQAYQKRAPHVVRKLRKLAEDTDMRLMVRLVKGAYWDTEIKHSQIEGVEDFPVFTTKDATDLNYLYCARLLMEAAPNIYPQIATHNAHTLAAVRLMAEELGVEQYEFQRLHGMGEALYKAAGEAHRVRVYAPVGRHRDLLPYLVRRLLENGANSSFVNTFLDPDVPVDDVVYDGISKLEAGLKRHPRIAKPGALYGGDRRNSKGMDLTRKVERDEIADAVKSLDKGSKLSGGPIISGKEHTGGKHKVVCPHDHDHVVGTIRWAETKDIDKAFEAAKKAQPGWDAEGGVKRADILRAMGQALEDNMANLIALMAREGGKTLNDGVAEVREAVDFCRYYAHEAETHFNQPVRLPGPTGETNHLSLHGRGVFVCISPWNFPLAIFTGQLAAALAAGNAVVAKPAEQTSLIACEAVKLFQKAGLPKEVLHLLPGDGETIGAPLTKHKDLAGVCFTGSTEVARLIHQTLAHREGPILPLIAETGGMNAMFVDTTALREQVIDDIIYSSFGSAGQRCSALRIAFLPDDTADMLIEGLKGAMDELSIGDPALPSTDMGPVIDAGARDTLSDHLNNLGKDAKILKRVELAKEAEGNTFFAPTLIEMKSIDNLTRETFGPILHVVRYDPDRMDKVCQRLESKGYGLTLGIHSRLESFAKEVRAKVKVGNTYVNRSMTGAVVGVQPFGGEGLSGTGPKAGGPHYLQRFAVERTTTVNTAAQGGDADLLNLH
ncbi:MAG: bifunctional proline dehydrogenase/L-glutamate gamma-semialdehyde dehydrogenase [Ponticaulis sp.]|nr:bifunctional proline dehydrogenase/L-glutamate gamma-semialdehyde dehydrogenase [Ponticaulis sp.]|tara:strand:- start:37532 stop:40669 length:3138 start_codon:yes stop_codon:yes gene_type:complete